MANELPKQKLAKSEKGKKWKEETLDYWENLAYRSPSGNRTTNTRKLINYDLFNGRFNKADLEYVCNPLGLKDTEFPATLQHYDIISPAIMLLLGEESKRPDNFRVVAENPEVTTRKEKKQRDLILQSLEQKLMAEIDPASLPIDPQTGQPQQPQTPEEIQKYMKYSYSDILETTGNKTLNYLKKSLNTKLVFNKGWKDALVAGEEIYWTGIVNGEPVVRRCNPPDIAVVLDNDSDFIDDAVAIIETRMMSVPMIVDEYGDDLTEKQISDIEDRSKGIISQIRQNTSPDFVLPNVDGSVPAFGSFNNSNGYGTSSNPGMVRVVRVEWQSLQKVGTLYYLDENDQPQETMVDETFKLSDENKEQGWKVEWFWINQAWEGVKIANEFYINIQPKSNQRRRLDNPYYCKLGYSGLLYNATNSVSVSLIDRMKPYQYLYNIIMYRLELAFASDMGKIMLMDLAQIPRSEGMDLEKWMYYLKSMKIAFINSHEEGKKGSRTGQTSNFNQFQSIDLTLGNYIQQHINTLEYIKQQIAFLSGISPQRLSQVGGGDGLGVTQQAIQQSAFITEYWFESHNEVKRRVYTSLIECAKIAWREGKKVQYVLDDLGIELLSIDGPEFENTEFGVFVSNSSKDQQIFETVKGLFQTALQSDKASLSDIAKVLSLESTQDMIRMLETKEEQMVERQQQAAQSQQEHEKELVAMESQRHQEELAERQADRDLKQYEIDSNNATKLEVATISALSFSEDKDTDSNGIPDVMEVSRLALDEKDLASKSFMEQSKLIHDKEKNDKQISLKEKEIKAKQDIEEKKLKMMKLQNENQIQLANKKAKLDKDMMDKKMKLEKMKTKAAISKSKQKKK